MTPTTAVSTDQPRRRSLPLVILDITAGIVLILFGLTLGYGVIVTALSIADNYRVDNETLKSAITTLMVALTIFGWAITSGMFLVRAIQRRYAFYWPIIGIIIILLSLYLGAPLIDAVTNPA